MKVNVVNKMKHDFTLKVCDEIRVYPPEGEPAHVEELLTEIHTLEIDGVTVPVMAREFGKVEHLPAPVPGTIYIVPSLVLMACSERTDLFAPDSGESAERNEKKHVLSVCQLIGQ